MKTKNNSAIISDVITGAIVGVWITLYILIANWLLNIYTKLSCKFLDWLAMKLEK